MKVMTFTGVDSQALTRFIKETSQSYTCGGSSAIEFGILRSPRKVGNDPRYPQRTVIDSICQYVYPQSLAFHLCGEYSEMALDETRWIELQESVDFNLVSRVQVNTVKDDAETMIAMQRFSAYLEKPVIMQWRHPIFPYVPGVSLLQDGSGGRGIPMESAAVPSALAASASGGGRFGYAGGITPDNIAAVVDKATIAARGKHFWLDCETGVRTNNKMDPVKIQAIIEILVAKKLITDRDAK